MPDLSLLSLDSVLKGTARQRNQTLRASGEDARGRFTFADQLFTAGWREELLLAGLTFGFTVGALSAGADVALVTGGGAGTTIDSDQPEFIYSVPAGYYLVPLSARIAGNADIDADGEHAGIVLFMDTTQAVARTGITGTAVTAKPLLGGGPEAAGFGWHTVTADLTDPVMSLLLAYERLNAADAGAAASQQVYGLRLEYDPLVPMAIKGPCSFVACWGGTAAVTALASFTWAEVPVGRFESQ